MSSHTAGRREVRPVLGSLPRHAAGSHMMTFNFECNCGFPVKRHASETPAAVLNDASNSIRGGWCQAPYGRCRL